MVRGDGQNAGKLYLLQERKPRTDCRRVISNG
jgi:hypothetical protein